MCTFLWNETCKSKHFAEIIIFIRIWFFFPGEKANVLNTKQRVGQDAYWKCCLDNVNIERVTFYQVRHYHYSSTAEIKQSTWQFYTICKIIMTNRHYPSLNWKMWAHQIKCAYADHFGSWSFNCTVSWYQTLYPVLISSNSALVSDKQ